jgi:hypothetical protein
MNNIYVSLINIFEVMSNIIIESQVLQPCDRPISMIIRFYLINYVTFFILSSNQSINQKSSKQAINQSINQAINQINKNSKEHHWVKNYTSIKFDFLQYQVKRLKWKKNLHRIWRRRRNRTRRRRWRKQNMFRIKLKV